MIKLHDSALNSIMKKNTDLKKECFEIENEIKKQEQTVNRLNKLDEVTKNIFEWGGGVIVGKEKNKQNEDVFVVREINGNNFTFKLIGLKYSAIINHPRLYARVFNDNNVIIDDILTEDNSVGNVSILMRYFLNYCERIGIKEIRGMLSWVDKDHFPRSIRFYKKHGFQNIPNEENPRGIKLNM